MADNELAAFEQAVRNDPGSAAAHGELALAYAEAGRLDEAAKAMARAVELAPDDVELRLAWASIAHVRGDLAVVEAQIHEALELAPDNPQVYRLIFQTSDQPDQRIDRLVGAARYLELAPDAPDAADYSGEMTRLLDAAATEAERALASDAADPGRAASDLGELLLVVPYLRRALPAASLTPVEQRLRTARVELLVAALEPTPDEPIAAARHRRAELPDLDAALDELRELADLGPLTSAAAAVRDELQTRREVTQTMLERLGLDDQTDPVFERVAAGNAALEAGQAEAATADYQIALQSLAELGDDRTGRLAGPAAHAYHGLAQALLVLAPADETRREHLELALEAANEAAEREPGLEQPFRQTILDALAALTPAPTPEPAPAAAETPPAPEPAAALPEPEPAPVAAEVTPKPAAAVPDPEPVADATLPVPEPPAVGEGMVVTVPGTEDLPALFAAAQAAFDAQRWDEALAQLEAIIAGTDERAYQALGLAGQAQVYEARGERGKALEYIEKATGRDSACVEAYLLRASIAEQTEDWPAALVAYQFAEAAAPDDPQVQRGIGLTLCQLEQWSEALPSLEKALATAPEDPVLCSKMGEAFLGLGRPREAVACFEEALNLGLQPPEAVSVKAFLDAAAARARHAPAARPAAPEPAAEEPEEEFDPDTAPPEVVRPKREEDQDVRARVLRKAVAGLQYDPLHHERCPTCRYPNQRGVERCERCNSPMHGLASGTAPRTRKGGGPCFIATAACQSPHSREVVTLRAYRETCLRPHWLGRCGIACYDAISPPLARLIASRPRLREAVRRRLIVPLARAAERRMARESS